MYGIPLEARPKQDTHGVSHFKHAQVDMDSIQVSYGGFSVASF